MKPGPKQWETCQYALPAGIKDNQIGLYGCKHPRLIEGFVDLIEINCEDNSRVLTAILCDNRKYNLTTPKIQGKINICKKCILYKRN